MTDLLTVKDVAKLLGLSTNTVYKYLNSGVIRSSRAQMQQGRFRVSKSAIEEFLGAPLEEISAAPVVEEPIEEKVATVEVEKVEATPAQSQVLEEKYEELLHSLLHDEKVASVTPAPTTTATQTADRKQAIPDTTESSIASTPLVTPPTFTIKATRILLLLGILLFVLNLAYFSPPHPIALFTQLSILFLFILLSYQYGGMRRRTP